MRLQMDEKYVTEIGISKLQLKSLHSMVSGTTRLSTLGGELIYPKLPKTKKTQCYQTFSGAVLCIKAGENFEFGER